jgi:hypothetical protein
VNDDLQAKRETLAGAFDQDAVLREIERDLQAIPPADVHDKYKAQIMRMDEDGRASALDMIASTPIAAE